MIFHFPDYDKGYFFSWANCSCLELRRGSRRHFPALSAAALRGAVFQAAGNREAYAIECVLPYTKRSIPLREGRVIKWRVSASMLAQ